MKKPKYLLVFMLLVLIIVFGLRLLIWLQQIESFPYYNIFTFTRIDGICIGSMIALLQRLSPRFLTKNVPWIVITFAVLNLLFDFINGYYNYSLPYLASAGYTTFALLFGLLVHEATLEKENWVKSIFSFPLLRFFGQISFGLYVFHWPLYVLLKPAMLQWLVVNGLSYVELVCSVLISLLAVLLSTLSYYFFERKFLAMKEKLA